MKIVIDHAGLQRKATLSHAASLGGLLVLLGSVAVSLWRPAWTTLTTVMLFAGFSISVIGIYYANRWVRKPRPEVVLDQALKGLDDQHRIYHYAFPCDHLLLTPTGLVVIETRGLEGVFTYREGRWSQKITAGRAMRFFVEERLGNPTAEAQALSEAMRQLLQPHLPENFVLPVAALVVFIHPAAEVHAPGAPVPVVLPAKLRRKLPKGATKLPADVYQQVRQALDRLASEKGAIQVMAEEQS